MAVLAAAGVAHVDPAGHGGVDGFPDELVEVEAVANEAVERHSALGRPHHDVGGLTLGVLRGGSSAGYEAVDGRRPEAAADHDGSEAVAQGLEHVLAERLQGGRLRGVGTVGQVVVGGHARACKLVELEVRCELCSFGLCHDSKCVVCVLMLL